MAIDVALELTEQASGLKAVAGAIAARGINIRGVCMYTYPAGIRGHVLLNDETLSLAADLKAEGFDIREVTPVVVLDLEDRPGVLQAITHCLTDADVALKFAYTSGPWLILGPQNRERCREALTRAFNLDDHQRPGRGVVRAMDPDISTEISALG